MESVGHSPVSGPTEDAAVIVADNASTDGSAEWMRQNAPGVRFIRFQKNYGFTGGYNRAFATISAELGKVPDYFLLINSDVEVTPDWLYPLEEWMEYHPECAVCGPKLHSAFDRDYFEYAGAAGGFLDHYGYPFCHGRVMGKVARDEGQYDSPEDVLWVSGACMMVRGSVWKELRGLDDRFFAHMEEIDFCFRARLAGKRVCVVPRSMVYHIGGGTLPQDSPGKLQLNYRNNLLMLENNMPYAYALSALYLVLSSVAEDFEYCTDEVKNCIEVFDNMDPRTKSKILETCASYGIGDTKKLLRIRKFLDRSSALVYRLQGKKDYAKAVKTAHKQFKELRKLPEKSKILSYLREDLETGGSKARRVLSIDLDKRLSERVALKCFARGAMIPLYYGSGEDVFERIDEEVSI